MNLLYCHGRWEHMFVVDVRADSISDSTECVCVCVSSMRDAPSHPYSSQFKTLDANNAKE